MILYLKEYADDWAVLANIAYAMDQMKKKRLSSEVQELETCNLSGLADDEPIWIVGHGNYGMVGGYSAHTLAQQLQTHGLNPAKKRNIKLLACMSGLKAPGAEMPSFAEELHRILEMTVIGIAGPGLNSVEIGENVIDPKFKELFRSKVQYPILNKIGLAENGQLHPVSSLAKRFPMNMELSMLTPDNVPKNAGIIGEFTASAYAQLVEAGKDYLISLDKGLVTFQ